MFLVIDIYQEPKLATKIDNATLAAGEAGDVVIVDLVGKVWLHGKFWETLEDWEGI